MFHLGAKYQRTPHERAAPVFQYLDSPTRIVIVFAISCQYDNSRPRHHAVANHQINMPSYRVVSTLPVPAVLRTAQSAQDGGYERLEEQAEDDDQDESQCIFHNLELISFPLLSGLPAPGMRFFSAFGKRARKDEGKPETENTLPHGRKIVRLPCLEVWLDASLGELRFAEWIYANTRGRMSGESASCQKKKDAAAMYTMIL